MFMIGTEINLPPLLSVTDIHVKWAFINADFSVWICWWISIVLYTVWPAVMHINNNIHLPFFGSFSSYSKFYLSLCSYHCTELLLFHNFHQFPQHLTSKIESHIVVYLWFWSSCVKCVTVVLTYLLTYGAEPFLRSCQLCSHSENSQQL
jgi:hypothetical protein